MIVVQVLDLAGQEYCFFVDDLRPTPLDADANDSLFKALVEPVVHPNSSLANEPAIYRCPHCCPHSSKPPVKSKPLLPRPTSRALLRCSSSSYHITNRSTRWNSASNHICSAAGMPATFHRKLCRIHVLIHHPSRDPP